jgi:choline dehydrogenase
MMYVRGQQADYDSLEQAGNPGWGWKEFLQAYLAMEDHSLGASPMRGSGGPLGVSVPSGTDDETIRMLLEASDKAGWPFVEDVNAEDAQHIGFTPSTIKKGIPQSTANAFLWPIRRRKNLTIATDSTVDVLRFDGGRVVGVGTQDAEYRARKDVILSAGAIESPLILERSGIGRPDVLARAGVDVRVESPNVGERVIEQHGAAVQVRFKREIGHTMQLSSKAKQLAQGARYLFTRKGPVATAGYDLMAHIKSRPEVDRPDIQVVAIPFALDMSSGLDVADYPGMYLLGYQIRPTTKSSIHITSSRPEAPPEIHANYLKDEEDRRVTGTIVDHLRSVLTEEPLASEIESEEFPGTEVTSAEQVLEFAGSPGVSVYHAVGSAGMGPNVRALQGAFSYDREHTRRSAGNATTPCGWTWVRARRGRGRRCESGEARPPALGGARRASASAEPGSGRPLRRPHPCPATTRCAARLSRVGDVPRRPGTRSPRGRLSGFPSASGTRRGSRRASNRERDRGDCCR